MTDQIVESLLLTASQVKLLDCNEDGLVALKVFDHQILQAIPTDDVIWYRGEGDHIHRVIE